MQLSKKAIEYFKKIYSQKYKVNLTDTQANELGLKVLRFYEFKCANNNDRHCKI